MVAKKELGIQQLQELARATCLRRTKEKVLASGVLALPHCSKRTQYVHLHPDDQVLYETVKKASQKIATGLDKSPRGDVSVKTSEETVMVLVNSLRLICNHGKELIPQMARSIIERSSASCVDQLERPSHAIACSSCGRETDSSSAFTGAQDLCIECAKLETTPSDPQLQPEDEHMEGESASQPASMGKSTPGKGFRRSAKVDALIKNLRQEASISDHTDKPRKRYVLLLPVDKIKGLFLTWCSVVFSCWVKMLDLIEYALRAEMISCQRIDGQKSLEGRRRALSDFNTKSDFTVMLISIGSAAEGYEGLPYVLGNVDHS